MSDSVIDSSEALEPTITFDKAVIFFETQIAQQTEVLNGLKQQLLAKRIDLDHLDKQLDLGDQAITKKDIEVKMLVIQYRRTLLDLHVLHEGLENIRALKHE